MPRSTSRQHRAGLTYSDRNGAEHALERSEHASERPEHGSTRKTINAHIRTRLKALRELSEGGEKPTTSDAEVSLKPTRRWSYLSPDIGMSPSTHQNASSTLQNAPSTDQNTENDKRITERISKHCGSFKSELKKQRRATPRWASSQHGVDLIYRQMLECHRARIRTP